MRYHVEAVGTYGYLMWREGCARAQAQRWFRIPFILFTAMIVMIAQLKLRTHSSTIPHSDISSLPLLPIPLFYHLFFSSFLGQLASLWFHWFLAPTPTYVPVTDSFIFYSTRVQYATCASTCVHTITPSLPYLNTYHRRSLYTSTVS